MSCSAKHINVAGSNECLENFSGIGGEVYYFFENDLAALPTYDEATAGFDQSSFTFKTEPITAGAYRIRIKPKSGKVDSTSHPNGKGFANTLTFVVDGDLENMALVSRAINNGKTGWLAKDTKTGSYYVIYDPDFAPEVTMEATTGDAPDSDKGFTVTVTCDPMKYPLPKWAGTLDIEGEQTPELP